MAYTAVRSKAVVLLLLIHCLLLLPLCESVIFLCFVVRNFMSIMCVSFFCRVYFPIFTTYNYKAVHFINTLARKGKRFVIRHLTVCMLLYSAVPEKIVPKIVDK